MKDANVAIFIADIDLAVHHQGRAPAGGKLIISPIDVARLGIQAVEHAREVGNVEQNELRSMRGSGTKGLALPLMLMA